MSRIAVVLPFAISGGEVKPEMGYSIATGALYVVLIMVAAIVMAYAFRSQEFVALGVAACIVLPIAFSGTFFPEKPTGRTTHAPLQDNGYVDEGGREQCPQRPVRRDPQRRGEGQGQRVHERPHKVRGPGDRSQVRLRQDAGEENHQQDRVRPQRFRVYPQSALRVELAHLFTHLLAVCHGSHIPGLRHLDGLPYA